MALREALILNEATPQIEVPQVGDIYNMVRQVQLITGDGALQSLEQSPIRR